MEFIFCFPKFLGTIQSMTMTITCDVMKTELRQTHEEVIWNLTLMRKKMLVIGSFYSSESQLSLALKYFKSRGTKRK